MMPQIGHPHGSLFPHSSISPYTQSGNFDSYQSTHKRGLDLNKAMVFSRTRKHKREPLQSAEAVISDGAAQKRKKKKAHEREEEEAAAAAAVAAAVISDGAAQKRKKKKAHEREEEEEEAAAAVAAVEGKTHAPATAPSNAVTAKEGGEGKKASAVAAHEKASGGLNLSEPGAIAAAIEHLKGCDAKLRVVIEASKLPSFQICTSPFRALVRGIVYQQLATNAGTAVYNRLLALCGGESTCTPAAILQLSAPTLRGIGVSVRKAGYLHDLSKHYLDGRLSDAAIELMDDDKLMAALTAVKGIGEWSVHRFMIFSLHRPDILPVGDNGVRKGFLEVYGLEDLPGPREMERLSAPWRPYRSLGAWYMLRVNENESKSHDGHTEE